tara:strand:+ start:192 stop:710 length:519 start_codon:yes stop_codon:yes gene_type:complete
MSNFYLADPNILTAPLNQQEFKIYHYLCKNYNVPKHTAFVKLVDIAGLFQLTVHEVETILVKFCTIKVNDLPLMSIKEDRYKIFGMPSHKKFLEEIGFKQNSSYKGYKAINGYLKQLSEQEQQIIKKYIYPTLDQYELQDKLEELPTDELKKIKKSQLKYPWKLDEVIKNRP